MSVKLDERIIKRFEELIALGDIPTGRKFSDNRFLVVEEWSAAVLSLLGRVFGNESVYYVRFLARLPNLSDVTQSKHAAAVLKAAFDEYRGGYAFDAKRAIQADIFDDFLEQAEYFLAEGYFQVAAVIAGAVLEDSLRKLCAKNSVPLTSKPKLDVMNADLAKAGIYDKLVLKKITWLADNRQVERLATSELKAWHYLTKGGHNRFSDTPELRQWCKQRKVIPAIRLAKSFRRGAASITSIALAASRDFTALETMLEGENFDTWTEPRREALAQDLKPLAQKLVWLTDIYLLLNSHSSPSGSRSRLSRA